MHTVKLKDQNNNVFYDKLTFIYLEMPNFKKGEHELRSRLDKWLYFLKHLIDFQEIPRIFGGEEVFTSAFAKAELAKFDSDDHYRYQNSLKVMRDWKGIMDTAISEATEKATRKALELGHQKGLEQAVAKLIASGMTEEAARRLLDLQGVGFLS